MGVEPTLYWFWVNSLCLVGVQGHKISILILQYNAENCGTPGGRRTHGKSAVKLHPDKMKIGRWVEFESLPICYLKIRISAYSSNRINQSLV